MVVLLLFLAPALFSAGQEEGLSSEERLRQAAELIAQEQYNQSVSELVDLVEDDPEQLEEAVPLFGEVLTVNEEYVAKGEEVQAQLQELLNRELTQEELIPTAIQALALIAEMVKILPNPNPRDAAIVEDLRYTVQLNIDRRRFQALMNAAAERLAAEDYSGAAAIYVGGIDDIAALTDSGTDDAPLFTLESGLDIQRQYFEDREYGLLGDQVAATRESMRSTGTRFVNVAPDALQGAADLVSSFAAGDFTNVQATIEEYLDLLQLVTEFVLSMEGAGVTLTEAEAVVFGQTLGDEGGRYDWHIRFLRDIVLGREDNPGVEGLLATVNAVLEIVGSGPVLAARAYADDRNSEATALLDGIVWPDEASGFRDLPEITSVVAEADGILSRASVAYLAYAEILTVSHSLGFTFPTPPEAVGELDDSAIRSQWLDYATSVLEALGALVSISDPVLYGEIESASILAASASSLRVIGGRSRDGLEAASSRRTTVSSLNSQRSGVQLVLGSLEEPNRGTLREVLARWGNFQIFVTAEGSIDSVFGEAVRYNEDYLLSRISDLERYELHIVEDVARIEYNGLNSRLSNLRTRVDGAERRLDGIVETVTAVDETGVAIRDDSGRIVTFRTLRKYPDHARDVLIPMVGRTSGTRILSTTSSEFQSALDDARAHVARYENELPYVVSAQTIQEEIRRGQSIVAAIGEVTQPALFGRGRDLLQLAINEIATAEDLESRGDLRVVLIQQLIDGAFVANEAEDLELAGENLTQAETLLKSNDRRVTDASDLFTESLATWYRPALEDRWNETQKDLNDQIVRAQADIVITRVQQDVREAQPLVDDQQWRDALAILEVADELWSSVFPTTVYPPLLRLLRFAETALAKENERELREDDPDYDKLAPLLSRATQAASDGLFTDATLLLEQFLRAQPNNLEARLLEVDIALGSEEGDLATKVNRLIRNSLPDEIARSQIVTMEPADALELQSLLIAILDRLEDQPEVNQAIISQISGEIDLLEAELSPPPIVVVTVDLRAESNALVDQALQNGSLETLSAGELAASLGFLEDALSIDPTNPQAIEQISLALRLPNAPLRSVLSATEQQVFKDARNEFARGDSGAALRLTVQLWADPDNRNDTELNRFREELLDAIRRGQ